MRYCEADKGSRGNLFLLLGFAVSGYRLKESFKC